eukprot:SAG31_NODE_29427_length_395_cov_1.216216_1_plen_47_part_10
MLFALGAILIFTLRVFLADVLTLVSFVRFFRGREGRTRESAAQDAEE